MILKSMKELNGVKIERDNLFTGSKTEKDFAYRMKLEGWQVHKNGFPDFLCIKDGQYILVEVKATKKEELRDHQLETMMLLNNRAMGAFVWNPEDSELIPIDKFHK